MNEPSADAMDLWRRRFRRPFAWMDSGLDWFERATLVICILAMAAVSIANVISRNTLGESLLFANDVTQILLVIVTFMGIGIGAREARHIRVSAIHDLLPRSARKVLLTIVGFATSAMLIGLAEYGWNYANQTQRTCRILPDQLDLGLFSVPLGSIPLVAGTLITLAAMILAGHAVRTVRERGEDLIQPFSPLIRNLILTAGFVALVLIGAWLFGWFAELVANRSGRCRVTSSTGFPVYLYHMIVPVGFLLGAIQFFLMGLRNVLSRDNYLSWYQLDEYVQPAAAGQPDPDDISPSDVNTEDRHHG